MISYGLEFFGRLAKAGGLGLGCGGGGGSAPFIVSQSAEVCQNLARSHACRSIFLKLTCAQVCHFLQTAKI